MATKSRTYWNPTAKGHLAAGATLSRRAPNLTKSAPVIQKKLASFRAAAKLANRNATPVKVRSVTSPTPDAPTPTPAVKPYPKAANLKVT